jgi:serine/threonine protein kinase
MPVPNQQGAAAGWIGGVLAGHRIDALIGEGGMGVVFRATHLKLRRTVALKVLPPALAADLDFRRRFEREAAIAASLEHPAVVPIYDAGHENGVLYLSMRFVDGDDLGAVLHREGPLGVERLCALLGPVADALDAVHEAGLVHRDVKPGNILIARPGRSRNGHVYLCDFGIAKGAGNEVTSAGTYLGTLQYSSPEQIQGRWLDGRSDQYGLACLAFRGLTGQVPFPRDDNAAVIYAHLVAPPPRPGLLRPDLPAAVDAAVTRAAAKDPGQRFPTCSAFVAALRDAAPRRTAPPSAPSRPRPHPGDAPAARERPAPPRPGAHLPPTRQLTLPGAGDPVAPPAHAATHPPAPDPEPASPVPTPGSRPARPEARPGTAGPAPAGAAGGPVDDPAPAVPAGPASAAAAPGDDTVPAPVDVHATRVGGDPSVTVTWTAGGPRAVEYKVTRLAPDGHRRVVGRTGATSIIDGAVAPDADVPVYEVVARSGSQVSAVARSVAPSAAGPRPATPDSDPGDIPAVRGLTVSAPGTLVFDWPDGVTEAMVVVRRDRPPVSPGDPAATSWKITNMRYQIDGGLLLPASVEPPCHVAVASCRRERGALVVAPGFDPSARVTVVGT